MRIHQRRFGILCVLAYVVLSWAVRFDMHLGDQIASLVYPLDTFSMYAGHSPNESSMLLVRDAQGAVHRVTSFAAFDCAEPLAGSLARCPEQRVIPYLYGDFITYIQRHRGRGTADAELVIRTWRLPADGPPVQGADCVIAHCRVAR